MEIDGTRVKAVSNLHQAALAHQLTQHPPHLVIAAEIGKIGAQKDIAALAVEAL
jgi:hypothetical protein